MSKDSLKIISQYRRAIQLIDKTNETQLKEDVLSICLNYLKSHKIDIYLLKEFIRICGFRQNSKLKYILILTK